MENNFKKELENSKNLESEFKLLFREAENILKNKNIIFKNDIELFFKKVEDFESNIDFETRGSLSKEIVFNIVELNKYGIKIAESNKISEKNYYVRNFIDAISYYEKFLED